MKWVVSAGDRYTAEAGRTILEAGGNAFDAAVAAVFAAAVAEPALTSCGGGGFLISRDSNGVVDFYDFFVNVPSGNTRSQDFYPVYVDFGSAVQEFYIGCASIAVPGVVAGMLLVHSEKGKLPLGDVLQPAISYAEKGINLSDLQASFVSLLEPIFTATDYGRKIYAPGGKLICSSETFTNPDYALFLKEILRQGSKFFYRGEVADRICCLCESNGGLITCGDLESYEVFKRRPLEFKFKDYTVFTNPPPSVGGALIAFTLMLIERVELGRWGSIDHISSLIESMDVTAIFRQEVVDFDPHDERILSLLKNEEFVNRFRQILDQRLCMWGSTTHISIIDGDGNMVSVTTTNGEGSGWFIPDTGVMLNNMLGEHDLNPGGFFKWGSGLRLPSMMAPTIVIRDDNPVLCLGSAGSNRIRSAIIQVIINSLLFGMKIEQAVDSPRVHYENGVVYVEPGFCDDVISAIEELYSVVSFSEKSLFFGGVQVVTGDFKGAGDSRRGGVILQSGG